MRVNFNNLRAQAAYALDKLTKELNAAKLPESEWVEVDGEWKTGDILLDAEDIQKHIDDLRMMVMSIASVYEEGNEDFKDMSDHIESTGGVAYFNEED